MASSRSNKLSKLKALRHGEDHDYNYVHTFDTINKENNRISENKSSINYEDGHNFEGFYVDSDLDFEGFHCNEGGNLKEYKDKFINMLQNLDEEEHLELKNYVDSDIDLDLDFDLDFSGFNSNEGGNLKDYKDKGPVHIR